MISDFSLKGGSQARSSGCMPLFMVPLNYITNWSKGLAVDGRWSQPAQGGRVLLCAIAFMLRQSVTGINLVLLYHQPVPGHFSHDGCTGDRETQAITMDYSFLWQRYFGEMHIVDEEVVRRWR